MNLALLKNPLLASLLLVAETKSVLGLVEDGLTRSAVDVLVLGTAELVTKGLRGGLVRVWDNSASDLVGGIGKGLANLVSGGLGGVGLKTLLHLCHIVSKTRLKCW